MTINLFDLFQICFILALVGTTLVFYMKFDRLEKAIEKLQNQNSNLSEKHRKFQKEIVSDIENVTNHLIQRIKQLEKLPCAIKMPNDGNPIGRMVFGMVQDLGRMIKDNMLADEDEEELNIDEEIKKALAAEDYRRVKELKALKENKE